MPPKYVSREKALDAAVKAGKTVVMKTQAEFDAWIAALESGEYRQGKGSLQTPDGSFCCLGVEQQVRMGRVETYANIGSIVAYTVPSLSYCYDNSIIYVNVWGTDSYAPYINSVGDDVTYLNDSLELSFPEIAKHLRESFMLWPTV